MRIVIVTQGVHRAPEIFLILFVWERVNFGPGWVKIPTPGGGGSGWVGRQAGTQKCWVGPPGSVKRGLIQS
jgi:hypothetical protein